MYELERLTAAALSQLLDAGVSVAVVPFGSIERGHRAEPGAATVHAHRAALNARWQPASATDSSRATRRCTSTRRSRIRAARGCGAGCRSALGRMGHLSHAHATPHARRRAGSRSTPGSGAAIGQRRTRARTPGAIRRERGPRRAVAGGHMSFGARWCRTSIQMISAT